MTAGPTWEPVDEVRYLGNRSSGRMGVEICRSVLAHGHAATLLHGPAVSTAGLGDLGSRARVVRFQTAEELDTLLRDHWPEAELLVMAAAVADYRPVRDPDAPRKWRRRDGLDSIALEPVPDLLAGLASLSHPGTRVGFALEPEAALEASARRKLERKDLHAIVANPLETMEADGIAGRVLTRGGDILEPPTSPCAKRDFADWLVPVLLDLHRTRVRARTRD